MKYQKPEITIYEAEELANINAGAADCGVGGSCAGGVMCTTATVVSDIQ